jgi:Protein of unknown function (DUF3305)
MNEAQTVTSSRFPVSVILQRREVRQAGMSFPSWQVVGVVAGGSVDAGQRGRTLIRSEGGIEQFLWPGLNVVLHKTDVESYWYNLVASSPSLFIICRPDGDDMTPVSVTVNYDEAGRCNEAEDQSYAVPLPPEMHQWLERYVMENYVPQEPKKRKKENWTEQSAFGRRPERNPRG